MKMGRLEPRRRGLLEVRRGIGNCSVLCPAKQIVIRCLRAANVCAVQKWQGSSQTRIPERVLFAILDAVDFGVQRVLLNATML
jgi:hypothetical protein